MTDGIAVQEPDVNTSPAATGTALKLVLEDGTEMSGDSFGAPGIVAGEVVFNTGMTGYVETLTDPSYKGQILLMTYPLVGNYGVPPKRASGTIDLPYESDQIQVQGLIVQNYVDASSHHAADRTLAEWLRQDGVPAIQGIDTRTLTRRLREHGTMRGWLMPVGTELDHAKRNAASIDMRSEVFRAVAGSEPVTYEGGDLRILAVDVGIKDNIIRSLLTRGATVVRAPWHADLAPLAESSHGMVIGNGPGDPKDLSTLIEQIRGLLGRYDRPIFGICLGNQILTLAAGGDTYKLPYGHRSVNQPVQDLLTRRCYITSQNHGYAVQDDALPPDWEPWFVNINDGTNEGVRSRRHPYFSVQFHPEANPGPKDTGFLFDDFLRLVAATAHR
ncbi:MAG: glutamine-hydrolyzing carbamoyl-phosphate synthase small subunit [Rhodothermales bacterium]|nr:glutamine-hydrolyzing carbamoyl-phosphate synthase small subunit [Rhodothermales bacterium]